jgi:hypothetical protein
VSSTGDVGSFPSLNENHSSHQPSVCALIQKNIPYELKDSPLGRGLHLHEEFSIVYCRGGWKIPLESFQDKKKCPGGKIPGELADFFWYTELWFISIKMAY